MDGRNQVCFLCDSKETIKRCVCDSFFQLVDNIQEPVSHQIYRRAIKPSILSHRKTYNLDCKGASTMCVSLDGKWIVSAFTVATRAATKAPPSIIQVWSVKDNYEYASLSGQRMISTLCMSADNKWIVSSGRDTYVMIWNLKKKSQVAVLEGHTDDINSVCISMDARWIISGSRDETIRIWSTDTMSEEAVLAGHERSVRSVCLSVDARYIVSGSKDRTVRVWSMKHKSQVAVLRGHTDDVNSVSISSDSIWIASVSHDNTVRLWNMLRNTQEAVFEAMREEYYVCITHDSRFILSSGDDQKVNVWSIDKKTQVAELIGDEGDHSSVALGHHSIWILSKARRVRSSDPLPNPFDPIHNMRQHRLFQCARRPLVILPRSNGEFLKASKFKLLV